MSIEINENKKLIKLKEEILTQVKIEQKQYAENLEEKMEECELKIEGRHDSCIVPRVVPCVEAMTALMLTDMIEADEQRDKH